MLTKLLSKRAFLIGALALNVIAFLSSLVAGPWNTYAHHTAVTGIAQCLFIGAFLISDMQRD